jgi:hypothetical protein
MTPISLKRALYAGAVTAAVSMLAAAAVGTILLAQSLKAGGHTSTSSTIAYAAAGFILASMIAVGASNLILVRPTGRVSRGRVTAAAVALSAAVPACAVLALLVGPQLISGFGLLLAISAPTAAAITLVVYIWARTAIPWVNRSATTPA